MKTYVITVYHPGGSFTRITGTFPSAWAAIDSGFAHVTQVADRITARQV